MATQEFKAARRTVQLGAIGGVVGPILFTILVIVGGVLYDGYSHMDQKVSELGAQGAEYAELQNFTFLMMGTLVIGFAYALARRTGSPYWGAVLIAGFGLSSGIGNSVFQCDAGCEAGNTEGFLHNATGLFGFLCAIAGMLVLARKWRRDPEWQSYSRFTFVAALVSIGGLAWFIVMQSTDTDPASGLAQRVFIVALLVWITVTAARLVVGQDRPSSELDGTRPAARHPA